MQNPDRGPGFNITLMVYGVMTQCPFFQGAALGWENIERQSLTIRAICSETKVLQDAHRGVELNFKLPLLNPQSA